MRDELLHSPATERNKKPILEVLRHTLPSTGLVLEIASGTGQHVGHFARELPNLVWQPTDPDEASRATIVARLRAANLDNVKEPVALDVLSTHWPVNLSDAILCINMIHISPWAATEALFLKAKHVLSSAGVLYLYGPYRQSGRHTEASNESFDTSLRSHNSEWGIRNLEDVTRIAELQGFVLETTMDMPANNLSVIFRNAL
ncbi:uncharacterized protein METZ01_LOCUS247619 [marine metagenome]|uniref:SAM-dependent methyltransferase n=1 Tax=marine metagenome TaxID=408172 RepID=A0A382I5T9_9ZZZZ